MPRTTRGIATFVSAQRILASEDAKRASHTAHAPSPLSAPPLPSPPLVSDVRPARGGPLGGWRELLPKRAASLAAARDGATAAWRRAAHRPPPSKRAAEESLPPTQQQRRRLEAAEKASPGVGHRRGVTGVQLERQLSLLHRAELEASQLEQEAEALLPTMGRGWREGDAEVPGGESGGDDEVVGGEAGGDGGMANDGDCEDGEGNDIDDQGAVGRDFDVRATGEQEVDAEATEAVGGKEAHGEAMREDHGDKVAIGEAADSGDMASGHRGDRECGGTWGEPETRACIESFSSAREARWQEGVAHSEAMAQCGVAAETTLLLQLLPAAAGCAEGCTAVHLHLPRSITLASALCVLGRAEECTVQLDAARHNGMVSRRHCALTRAAGGAWEVEDLSSRNGTFVNGRRLSRSARRATLHDGDVLHLGALRGECVSDACYLVSHLQKRKREDTIHSSSTATSSSSQL
ncbi:hypothetical protein AB1Y20_013704 [Prymnesium parvum]|uniref:FHA domain-containing protein n=1 Tax=Prymnesium parvum TaxID=97485 RepID=A0AB34IJQ2_PRYPA